MTGHPAESAGGAALARVVIVGASLAGLRAAESLRGKGFAGSIVMVGDEPHFPYDRPPLSKQVLKGDWPSEKTALRSTEVLDKLQLTWRLGRRAAELNAVERLVLLDDGSVETYDRLILACGTVARSLPGQGLSGVYTLRTLEDALAIREALSARPRVVVIGAGFIGAEVAAVCRSQGLSVTMVDLAPLPLSQHLGTFLGEAALALHRQHGVDFVGGVSVTGFLGEDAVTGVRLSNGSTLPAELVVVGIGVRPNTDWLQGSGLSLSDGIDCDATCAASIPGVFAAGDVARWFNPLFGESMRVEHWMNAVEQGAYVGERVLKDGDVPPFLSVPSFWSDQFQVKIQLAGRVRPTDEVRLVQGTVESFQFVALYGRAGRLTGVLAFNQARGMIVGKRLLKDGASLEVAAAQLGAS